MSTYRERRAARAERLRGWADKREEKAGALHARNEPYRGDIAFTTQPGHIPERARAIARTERAWEHSRKAESMRSRAEAIDRAAANAIYSDDPDAIPALEAKIGRLEAERARIKAYNLSCRKGAPNLELLDDKQRRTIASTVFVGKRGEMPAYALSNLGATIRTAKQRLEHLERLAQAETDRAIEDAWLMPGEAGEFGTGSGTP